MLAVGTPRRVCWGSAARPAERLIGHMHAMVQEATLRLYAEYGRPPEALSWTMSAWANVNQQGDFNTVHTHPGATWSGVYYVDHGEAEAEAEGAALQLSDPCPPRTNLFFPDLLTADFRVKPIREGLTGAVSQLRAALRCAASRGAAADFDRIRCTARSRFRSRRGLSDHAGASSTAMSSNRLPSGSRK